MGFFSWKTADTKKSIANVSSGQPTMTVYLTAPDGTQFKEDDYEGYGDFGGKDIYELVAELNDLQNRSEAIKKLSDITNGSLNFADAASKMELPTLTEDPEDPFQYGYPENCPYQGYFFPSESESEIPDHPMALEILKPITNAFFESQQAGNPEIEDPYNLRYALTSERDESILTLIGTFLEALDEEDEPKMIKEAEKETLKSVLSSEKMTQWFADQGEYPESFDESLQSIGTLYDRFVLNANGRKEETFKIPSHTITALQYGDYSGLNDDEIEEIQAFEAESGIIHISHVTEYPEFENTPEFGKACDCFEVTACCKLSEEEKADLNKPSIYKIQGEYCEDSEVRLCWNDQDGWVHPDQGQLYPIAALRYDMNKEDALILNQFGALVDGEKASEEESESEGVSI